MQEGQTPPDPQTRYEITEERMAELKGAINHQLRRVYANLERIAKLVAISETFATDDKLAVDDALRAAVVLLHAMLEDVMRTVGAQILPSAPEAVLDSIAFAGSKNSQQPEKVYLGRLARHRGKSVDAVIEASVQEHLARLTFNSPTDVDRFFKMCGIEASAEMTAAYPVLGSLMARRHKIVHNADLEGDATVATPLSAQDVATWTETVGKVASALVTRAVTETVAKTWSPISSAPSDPR